MFYKLSRQTEILNITIICKMSRMIELAAQYGIKMGTMPGDKELINDWESRLLDVINIEDAEYEQECIEHFAYFDALLLDNLRKYPNRETVFFSDCLVPVSMHSMLRVWCKRHNFTCKWNGSSFDIMPISVAKKKQEIWEARYKHD